MNDVIEVPRLGRDAATLAAQTAALFGTKLNTNLRWYGASFPAFREAGTRDGRTIRILER